MHIYNKKFYESQKDGSLRSAEIIFPYVFDILRPKSVIDVGCGLGTWLCVAKKCGVREILGIDGDYVNRKELFIAQKEFQSVHLSKRIELDRKFELILCLEVGEHIDRRDEVVCLDNIASFGDAVLFGAAIPFQGGTNHVNLNWQQYWVKQFEKRGYIPIDCVRPVFWSNSRVEYFYLQNTILYVKRRLLKQNKIRNLHKKYCYQTMNIVHPVKYLEQCSKGFHVSIKGYFKLFPSILKRIIKKIVIRNKIF